MPKSHTPTGGEDQTGAANPSVESKELADTDVDGLPSKGQPAESRVQWFAEGLRFECTQCGDCCTGSPGAVWVTDDELAAIARELGQTIGEVRLLHTKMIAGRWSLRDYPNGDCVYLDPATRKCRVYSARPVQCRTWPFWKSNIETRDSWARTCDRCPGAGAGSLFPVEQIIQQAAQCDV